MLLTYKEKLYLINNYDKMYKYKKLYSLPTIESCLHFINNWVFTYNPRNEKDKVIPFHIYNKQIEFINWMWNRYKIQEDGAVDKCRDIGATWCFIAFATWLLLFQKESAVGVYTFKATECHRSGDPGTLLGKVEFILNNLPYAFKQKVNIRNMYILNSENGASIAGASGENPFRGDRKTIVGLDEVAFYEQDEKIEAAMSEVSLCKIYVSTHAGTDTIFYRKVSSGAVPVFTFDWYDNPIHTKKWFDNKKQKAEQEGTMHIFQREILRNAHASVASVLIPSIWVNCAKQVEKEMNGKKIIALDVADEGTDTTAMICFDGNMPIDIDEWSTDDPNESARRVFFNAMDIGAEEIRYDCIGVGAGVKAGFNVIIEELVKRKGEIENELYSTPDMEKKDNMQKEIDKINKSLKIKIIGWSAAGKVVRPDDNDYGDPQDGDKNNGELFENSKAQAWFKVRSEFLNTYYYINNKKYDPEKIINFKHIENHRLFTKLSNELSQPIQRLSARGKTMVDKKGKNSKSPNLADAYVIGRAEIEVVFSVWDA